MNRNIKSLVGTVVLIAAWAVTAGEVYAADFSDMQSDWIGGGRPDQLMKPTEMRIDDLSKKT